MPEFEWDPTKAASSLRKHGIPFEHATRVLLDEGRLDHVDSRRNYGEELRITMGIIEGRVYVVVYTKHQAAIRLISTRKANNRETITYHTLSAGPG